MIQENQRPADQCMGYQPVVTQVNLEEHNEFDGQGILAEQANILTNQEIIKPGQRKFVKDAQGYD